MKVIHSGHLNLKSGGPSLSAWLTIKGLRQVDVDAQIIVPQISNDDCIIDQNADPIYCNEEKFGSLGYVAGYRRLLNNLEKPDLFHIQGLWMMRGKVVSNYSIENHIPYIVTLRGMLYPQAIVHHKLLKSIVLHLYQSKVLKNAAAVQCTCIEEMGHYRKLGFNNPVAVIPNPIETDKYINHRIPQKEFFRIGYLGRIHPRKRIERLIYAMKNLKDKLQSNSELLIIGGGDENYEKFLHNEVSKLNLGNYVKFTGFLSGKEKESAIDSLSLLVVPSDFENFGNIVTEALVHGVPVIASKGMPWQELSEYGCGWWISNNQTEIDKTILEAYQQGNARLMEMGIKGKKLMQERYSVEALGMKMKLLYQWVLGEINKPDFVYTD